MKSDADLVTETIAGNGPAFAELVARHEKSMRAIAFHILRDHHAAEDVTQDAFVAAYRALPRLRDRRAFRFWVAKILRRQARKAGARRHMTAPLDAASEISAPPPDGDFRMDLDSDRLLVALMALSEEERAVLMMRHFDGFDVQSIARMMGEATGTVTKRISRGHAHLRERLKEYDP